MTHTYTTVAIGNKEHKILTGSYPKQCEAYYEAMKRGDFYAAHMLHLPYVPRDSKMVQFEIDTIAREQFLEEEIERVNKLPKELLKIEIENRFK